ncbi:MAG: GNAT family N-acetyltransferase [Bacteroidetes bacterium]|jgi:RimJ/RimL family protein N-acetyltransferase|nr:GNAT family N-acetyltransferase [Bacteroidota bacterium]
MDVVARDSRVLLTTLDWTNFYQHYQWSNDSTLQHEEVATTFPREPVYAFKQRFEAMMRPDRQALDLEIHTVAGTLIGVAYIDWQSSPAAPQVGLTICDTPHRGQGLGKAAFEVLLEMCFTDRPFERVRATARPFQRAWLRLLRQAGFTVSAPDASPTPFSLSRQSHRQRPLSRPMAAKAA